LAFKTVALPAAEVGERDLALGGVARRLCRGMTEDYAGRKRGQRNAKHWMTHDSHFPD